MTRPTITGEAAFTDQAFLASEATTSDLADLIGDGVRSCDTPLRNFGGRACFTGRVRTIRCHDDNALLQQTVRQDGTGTVLVVDGAGSHHTALIGDMYAQLAQRNGWEGIVINGVIRDVRAVGTVDLGVKALGSNPRKSNKAGLGDIDVPVSFGGITFNPGETLYSDEDGIIVVDG